MPCLSLTHAGSRFSRLVNSLLPSPVGFYFRIHRQTQLWNCTLALGLVLHSGTPGSFFKLVSLRSRW